MKKFPVVMDSKLVPDATSGNFFHIASQLLYSSRLYGFIEMEDTRRTGVRFLRLGILDPAYQRS